MQETQKIIEMIRIRLAYRAIEGSANEYPCTMRGFRTQENGVPRDDSSPPEPRWLDHALKTGTRRDHPRGCITGPYASDNLTRTRGALRWIGIKTTSTSR